MLTKRKAMKMLREDKEIICLDAQSQAVFASVGLEMALKGQLVKAKLVNAWNKEKG